MNTKVIKFIKETISDNNSLNTEEKKSKIEKSNNTNSISISNSISNSNYNGNSNSNNEIKSNLLLRKKRSVKKSLLNIEKLNLNFQDKCFPFKSGKGIINIATKYQKDFMEPFRSENDEYLGINKDDKDNNENNLDDNDNSDDDYDICSYNQKEDEKEKEKERVLDLNLNLKGNQNHAPVENELYLKKFATEKYFYGKDGKRKRFKKKRKDKADIIRKKIKSRFHKAIKVIINNNLRYAESQLEFEYLPQCFIGNVSKLFNCKYFDFTYKEILSYDFGSELIQYRHTSRDYSKYLKNLKVLEYLDNNPEISKKSGFDLIKNLKLKDLLLKYFLSLEFEDSINKLKKENESEEYIQLYIVIAKNYINYYYNNFQFLNNDNNNNGMEIKEDEKDEDNER